MKTLTNEEIVKKIQDVANKGVTIFEINSKTDFSNSSTFEVFMFNTFLAETYYIERDYLDASSDIDKQNLTLFTLLARYFSLDLDVQQIAELYKERIKNFKEDVRGIQNTNYPQTKAYLPAYTFAAIYYDQLQLTPNLSWCDSNDSENFDPDKMDELLRFTKIFIQQINWIIDKMSL